MQTEGREVNGRELACHLLYPARMPPTCVVVRMKDRAPIEMSDPPRLTHAVQPHGLRI